MNTVEEILRFAIEREVEAAEFYADLATRTEAAGMREVFLEFSAEELRHKARLEAVQAGAQRLAPEQSVVDLKIADYLVDVPEDASLNYQDALIVAMKREQAAYRLYSDMAEQVDAAQIREVFLGLAKEEARHKLYFESEYDERVLREN